MVEKSYTIDLQVIEDIYVRELNKLKALNNKEFQKEKERIDNISWEKQGADNATQLREIIKPENRFAKKKLPFKKLLKLGKEYKPKNLKDPYGCFKNYKNIKLRENDDGDGLRYSLFDRWVGERTVKLKNTNKTKTQKYYIRVKPLDRLNIQSYKTLKKQLKLTIKASKLGITSKIVDIYICKDTYFNKEDEKVKKEKNSWYDELTEATNNYGLFIVKEFIENETLTTYMRKNKLTNSQIKQIKTLIRTCFKNNILLEEIYSSDILVIPKRKSLKGGSKLKGDNVDFILSNLNSATPFETLIEEKEAQIYDSLEILEKRTDNVIVDLCIDKLIKDKLIILKPKKEADIIEGYYKWYEY